MKKVMSIVVSILFAVSLSGLAFAQPLEMKPAGEPAKVIEKAPAKVKKAKKAPKTKKTKKVNKAKKAQNSVQAPAR